MIEITQEDYYISSPAEPEEWFMTINLHAQKIEDASATKDIIVESINNYTRLVEDVKDLSNMVVEERTEKERIKKGLSNLIDNLNDSLHDKFVSDDIVGELIRIREGDK